MRIKVWAAALSLAGAGVPVAAGAQAQAPAPQARGRVLAVPARSSWQHAETQMILPPQVAGLARGEIKDLGRAEMDVLASYGGTDGVFVTVYLFRTGLPDAALWYDRAAAVISFQPEYGLAGAALPAPTAFVRPGAAVASGLRTATDLSGGPLRSTAVAVAPLGGNHLLKIRISAQSLDRAALDALLGRVIEGLRWPAPAPDERAAVPIGACAEPLRLRNARVLRPDMTESLIDALTGVAAAQPDPDRRPTVYCREAGSGLQYGVYRPNASRTSYVIALGDAGIALSLGRAISLEALTGGGGRSRVGMTLLERASTSVLLSFNRLPPPAQAVSVAMSGQGSGISVSTDAPRN
ncbi:MAG TPA: hypothetical protein VGB79_12980 [Allosphingosinicella sp.]|jgi:hypothetical protein